MCDIDAHSGFDIVTESPCCTSRDHGVSIVPKDPGKSPKTENLPL